MGGTVTSPADRPGDLMGVASEIYRGVVRPGSHAWLVGVLRPLYAPFHLIFPWIPEGARVLDVGCGTGAFLLLAERRRGLGPSTGYDVNPASLSLARAAEGLGNVRFEVGSRIPDEVIASASVVTLIDVLHHLRPLERQELLEGIVNRMAPGARLIAKDLDPRPRWRATANRITDFLSTRSRVDYLAMDTLAGYLEREGFAIEACESLPRHVWAHYLVVADKGGAVPEEPLS